MVDAATEAMADRRALLTDREREIITGAADVTDEYRYQTVSRIRRRLKDRLTDDLDAMDRHGGLGDDVRDIVCEGDDG